MIVYHPNSYFKMISRITTVCAHFLMYSHHLKVRATHRDRNGFEQHPEEYVLKRKNQIDILLIPNQMRKWSGQSNNNNNNKKQHTNIVELMHVHRPKLTSHIVLRSDGFIAPQSRALVWRIHTNQERRREEKKNHNKRNNLFRIYWNVFCEIEYDPRGNKAMHRLIMKLFGRKWNERLMWREKK